MSDREVFSWDTFLRQAREAGLATGDEQHMQRLFLYVNRLLPRLKGTRAPEDRSADSLEGKINLYVNRILPDLRDLDRLSLSDVEPVTVFRPGK